MHAVQLIAIATAHGIDLSSVGGSITETRSHKRRRRAKRDSDGRVVRDGENRIVFEPTFAARGVASRSHRRSAWSHAELGMAAGNHPDEAGVPRLPWLAARLAFAGDPTGYWELWAALVREAIRFGRRDRWSATVPGEDGSPLFYREKLASLVLDEEVHRRFFATSDRSKLCAAYMGVTVSTWLSRLEEKFTALKARFEMWVSTARGIIQRWLTEDALVAA